MSAPVLVTGGTGTLGRHVVSRLRDAGRDVRVLSRHGHAPGDGVEYATGDLLKDEGIEPAVDGARVIVHCAGGRKGDDEAARNLVRAASRAGAEHLVYISVIGAGRIPVVSGIDRAMFGYFESKLAAERVVAESGLPWTTLRAAQFHDLLLTVAQQVAKLPVMQAPDDGAALDPRQGRSRLPGRRKSRSRTGCRSANVGGLPGGARGLAARRCGERGVRR